MALEIGELSYISGLPISWAVDRGMVSGIDLKTVTGLPGELDALMESGRLAAGPISSLEYVRHRDQYDLIPDLGISSWGRVGSSILFSRVPFSRLTGESIALPRFGATSNVLVQWLLFKMFGVEAKYEERDGDLDAIMKDFPAVLLIGDQAVVEARRSADLLQLDTGEAWWQIMKTPMVHSVWACQASLPQDQKDAFAAFFAQAKAIGKDHHGEVITEAAQRLQMPEDVIEAYYALLNFDLSAVHMQSLNLFADFIPEVVPLR